MISATDEPVVLRQEDTQEGASSEASVQQVAPSKRPVGTQKELGQQHALLATRPNENCPASCLPPEILSRVFGYTKKLTLIQVTWVCGSWRKAALGCATLWTNLPFYNPEFTQLALSRSKGARLNIRFDASTTEDPDKYSGVLRKALSLTERLRLVFLKGPGIDDLLTGCTGNAPILKYLKLVDETPADSGLVQRGPSWPIAFLELGAPLLRKLDLAGCNIPFTCIPFSSRLTVLKLDRTHWKTQPGAGFRFTSIDHLVGVLRPLARLKELVLEGMLPSLEEETLRPARLLIPPLAYFRLDDDAVETLQFLSFISLSELPFQFHVHCQGLNDLTSIRRFVATFKGLLSTGKETARLAGLTVGELDPNGRYTSTFTLQYDEGLGVVIHGNSVLQFDDMAPTLLDVLDITPLKSFSRTVSHLAQEVGISPPQIYNTLRHLPDLQAVDIWYALDTLNAFVETLEADPFLDTPHPQAGSDPDRASSPSPATPYFPALSELTYWARCACECSLAGEVDVIPRLTRVTKKRSALGLTPPWFMLVLMDECPGCEYEVNPEDYTNLKSAFPRLDLSVNHVDMVELLKRNGFIVDAKAPGGLRRADALVKGHSDVLEE